MLGLTFDDYRRLTERVNVLDRYPGEAPGGDRFPVRTARAAADLLRMRYEGRSLLLIGFGVARAFRVRPEPLFVWRPYGGLSVMVSPHTSGRNRWWNDPKNRERAEAELRTLGMRLTAGRSTTK